MQCEQCVRNLDGDQVREEGVEVWLGGDQVHHSSRYHCLVAVEPAAEASDSGDSGGDLCRDRLVTGS